LKGPVIEGVPQYPTDAQDRIYPLRIRTIRDPQKEIPCLLIYTLDEDSSSSGDGNYLDRVCRLTLEFVVAGKDTDVEEDADKLCAQVEETIKTDPRLGGLLSRKGLVLKSTNMQLSGGGNLVYIGGVMEFDAHYTTILIEEDEGPDRPTEVFVKAQVNADAYEDILDPKEEPIVEPPQSVCDPLTGCDLPEFGGLL
jgi:hypothetical protein